MERSLIEIQGVGSRMERIRVHVRIPRKLRYLRFEDFSMFLEFLFPFREESFVCSKNRWEVIYLI